MMRWLPEGTRDIAAAYATCAGVAGLMGALAPEMAGIWQGWIIVGAMVAAGALVFSALKSEWQRSLPAVVVVVVLGGVAFGSVYGIVEALMAWLPAIR